MPTQYTDQFLLIDAAAPPGVGVTVTFERFDLVDQNDDGDIDSVDSDTINASTLSQSYPGDTITLNVPGIGDVTYSGTTVYLNDGTALFTPTDGQVLAEGTFVSATIVSGQGPLLTSQLGPSCFLPGTLIATPDGPRNIEKLHPGDLITTADAGSLPIIFVRRETLSVPDLVANPRRGPVRIPAAAFSGSGLLPDLLVSPQHRMLLRSKIVQRMYGVPEILAPAAQLIGFGGIERMQTSEPVTYIHLLLERHSIIEANGFATESLWLNTQSVAGFTREEEASLRSDHPRLLNRPMIPAREFVSGKRLKHLLMRHVKSGKRLCDAPTPLPGLHAA